jgi:hypothetical protein
MNPAWIGALLIAAMFAVLMVCVELGIRIGRCDPERGRSGTSVVEAALFGLLGLILGFTFGGGLSRLDTRRQQIVNEANVISTAYRRIDVLSSEDQPAMRTLFRRYLEARLAAYEDVSDLKVIRPRFAAAEAIQNEIWELAIKVYRGPDRQQVAMLFLPAIGQMFDVATERAMAIGIHTPPFFEVLILAVALSGAVLAGYSMSSRERRSWLHIIVFALTIAMTSYALIDVDYPRLGIIRVDSSDQALTQLCDLMK